MLLSGAGLLFELPPAVRRAAFAITVIVAANLAGRFDAPPAQYGSAALVLIAWLMGSTSVLPRTDGWTRGPVRARQAHQPRCPNARSRSIEELG